ncbi:unnamed protein product [Adineta ricciae]|uniref:Fe2OG dioxygenase domain-containing protein n=1 Tax=Adineta ricciae TaxID=249248 RepID=A0A814TDD3_ADIRI|nr:unnamed protein product [Adineta ricciae]CAF1165637.1 unnamed protein product [Adineta ricciae]
MQGNFTMKSIIHLTLLFLLNAQAFNANHQQDQCDNLCAIEINEIDMSKFLSGTDEEKKHIAALFDRTFHEQGVTRLINNNITSELMAKAKEFFALDLETKMKYNIDRHDITTSGYKPLGFETVANYKNEKQTASTDSTEAFFTYFKSQPKQLNFPADKLPEQFSEIIPEYIFKSRQLIALVHRIVDMALGLDENTLDRNYTNDDALFSSRLTRYLPTEDEHGLAFGEHQDYLGFTLLQNDDVPGLEVNIDGRWFRVDSKPNTLILLGGELIQRWTNNYWISILHRVSAVKQLRFSVLFFTGPDVNTVIETLPCEKCLRTSSKYTPVSVSEHLKRKQEATLQKDR